MNLSFFYLSPLSSICKLTQNSPLGELIKLLYYIDCLIYKMLFIKEVRPNLNTQALFTRVWTNFCPDKNLHCSTLRLQGGTAQVFVYAKICPDLCKWGFRMRCADQLIFTIMNRFFHFLGEETYHYLHVQCTSR